MRNGGSIPRTGVAGLVMVLMTACGSGTLPPTPVSIRQCCPVVQGTATALPIAPLPTAVSQAAATAIGPAATPTQPAVTVPANSQVNPVPESGSATTLFNPAQTTISLQPLVSGFDSPTDIVSAGDGSKRLFVLEKKGLIRIIENDHLLDQPFLSLTSLVRSSGSEQGLLGLAFHPHYSSNGLFFVNYIDLDGNSMVARYKVSANADVADPKSATVLLHVDQPAPNHNGGDLVFGPDGYLYIGFGDGGGAGDQYGNSQKPGVLLAKMLRIDVDNGQPYGIPPDNPFIHTSGFRPEIWAWGLRNPWRYSFDRATGDLYIADVGQNKYEEIDVQPAHDKGAENYGWNKMEGLHCYPDTASCDPTAFVTPVAEYTHQNGACSVTGGYVYRGQAQAALTGAYLYADFCSGQFWALWRDAAGKWMTSDLLPKSVSISSFGQDEDGELYVAGYSDGVIYRIVAVAKT